MKRFSSFILPLQRDKRHRGYLDVIRIVLLKYLCPPSFSLKKKKIFLHVAWCICYVQRMPQREWWQSRVSVQAALCGCGLSESRGWRVVCVFSAAIYSAMHGQKEKKIRKCKTPTDVSKCYSFLPNHCMSFDKILHVMLTVQICVSVFKGLKGFILCILPSDLEYLGWWDKNNCYMISLTSLFYYVQLGFAFFFSPLLWECTCY